MSPTRSTTAAARARSACWSRSPRTSAAGTPRRSSSSADWRAAATGWTRRSVGRRLRPPTLASSQQAEGLIGPLTSSPIGGFADLRNVDGARQSRSPFDEFFHTADTRAGQGLFGWHNIPHLGVFVWRLLSLARRSGNPGRGAELPRLVVLRSHRPRHRAVRAAPHRRRVRRRLGHAGRGPVARSDFAGAAQRRHRQRRNRFAALSLRALRLPAAQRLAAGHRADHADAAAGDIRPAAPPRARPVRL